jgi:transcriptional regulator with XRE-family HTH domain
MDQSDETAEQANPNGPTAKLIAEARAKGVSQGELARLANLPPARISRWARGMNTSATDDVLRLKEIIGRLRVRKPRQAPQL